MPEPICKVVQNGHAAISGSEARANLIVWAERLRHAEILERLRRPATVARQVADDLLAQAQVAPGYLGFESKDVVVTVPARLWSGWLNEGDAADEARREGVEYWFNLSSRPRGVHPGARVYVVAHGKLRGYAPLHRIDPDPRSRSGRGCLLIRRGGAVAVTIDEPVRGFLGYRYRWWDRDAEKPFPNWKEP